MWQEKFPSHKESVLTYPDSEALEGDKEADKAGHCFSG